MNLSLVDIPILTLFFLQEVKMNYATTTELIHPSRCGIMN